MSIAFFGQGMTNLGWTVVSDIAPKKLIGLTGGIFNFSANLAGIVTPLVIGIAFELTGSFVGPLVYIAVVALVGAFSYSVILGDIHRLEIATRTSMPIDGFQHVNIRTTDVERAREFYVRALGLRVGDRPPFASVGYWLYLGDQPVVHLVQLRGRRHARAGIRERLDHVAFHGVDHRSHAADADGGRHSVPRGGRAARRHRADLRPRSRRPQGRAQFRRTKQVR